MKLIIALLILPFIFAQDFDTELMSTQEECESYCSFALNSDREYRLFPFTNEEGIERTLGIMGDAEKMAGTQGEIFIGVSGMTNLDMVSQITLGAKQELKHVLILDVSPIAQTFWGKLRTFILEENTRLGFISRLKKEVGNRKKYYFPPPMASTLIEAGLPASSMGKILSGEVEYQYLFEDKINDVFSNRQSWLGSEESYLNIRILFSNKKISFLRANLMEKNSLAPLIKKIKNREYKIHTLYLSNIAEYSSEDKNLMRKYKESIEDLIDITTAGTLIINTNFKNCENSEDKLIQRRRRNVKKENVGDILFGEKAGTLK